MGITQVSSCAAAATFLGIEYDEELSGEDDYYDDDYYESTCFASYIDDAGNVNKMDFPSVARVASNHYTYAGWVLNVIVRRGRRHWHGLYYQYLIPHPRIP